MVENEREPKPHRVFSAGRKLKMPQEKDEKIWNDETVNSQESCHSGHHVCSAPVCLLASLQSSSLLPGYFMGEDWRTSLSDSPLDLRWTAEPNTHLHHQQQTTLCNKPSSDRNHPQTLSDVAQGAGLQPVCWFNLEIKGDQRRPGRSKTSKISKAKGRQRHQRNQKGKRDQRD